MLEITFFGLTVAMLAYIVLGLVVGILVGAAPGLGPSVGMSVLLPISLTMDSHDAVVFLMAVFIGSNYGNSIPAVLVKIPGTPSALLSAIEGHPFTQRGEPDRALGLALTGSVVGQLIGVGLFALFVVPLADIAVKLLFPELTAVVLIGLLASAAIMGRSLVKGVAAIAVGFMLAIVGTDAITGLSRWDFGLAELSFGLEIVPTVIGLLAISEILAMAGRHQQEPFAALRRQRRSLVELLGLNKLRVIGPPMVVGAAVGVLIGAVPGAGAAVAAFVAYQVLKSIGRWGEGYGKGSQRALAGTEASNNAAAAGELIPTLAIGIPGGTPMVLILAALTAHGLVPGPGLLRESPGMFGGIVVGLVAGSLLLGAVGLLAIRPAALVSRVPRPYIATASIVLVVAGVYSLRWKLFDVGLALVMGILGWLMHRYGYPVAAAALAFILADLFEANLRRGLVMTRGWEGFLTRPVTAGLLLVAVAIIISALVGPRLKAWIIRRSNARRHIGLSGPPD